MCRPRAEQSVVLVEAHVTFKCSTAATSVEQQHSLLCVEKQSFSKEVQNSQFRQKQCGDDRSVEAGHLDNFWTGLDCGDRADSVSPRNLTRDRNRLFFQIIFFQTLISDHSSICSIPVGLQSNTFNSLTLSYKFKLNKILNSFAA